jgi:hypothetical protein
MPSSLFNCVVKSDLARVKSAAGSYKKMSNIKVVMTAGHAAGELLLDRMHQIIMSDSSLAGFTDVANALTVFEDGNVVAGLPPGHPLVPKARQMEELYPVADVIIDMAKQSGDVAEAFYNSLAEQAIIQ